MLESVGINEMVLDNHLVGVCATLRSSWMFVFEESRGKINAFLRLAVLWREYLGWANALHLLIQLFLQIVHKYVFNWKRSELKGFISLMNDRRWNRFVLWLCLNRYRCGYNQTKSSKRVSLILSLFQGVRELWISIDASNAGQRNSISTLLRQWIDEDTITGLNIHPVELTEDRTLVIREKRGKHKAAVNLLLYQQSPIQPKELKQILREDYFHRISSQSNFTTLSHSTVLLWNSFFLFKRNKCTKWQILFIWFFNGREAGHKRGFVIISSRATDRTSSVSVIRSCCYRHFSWYICPSRIRSSSSSVKGS